VEADPKIPPRKDSVQARRVPPPLPASEPPVIGAAPPLAAGSSPPLPAKSPRKSVSARGLVAILLSLCLGLFLADAVISLIDDSLIVLFDVHHLSVFRGLVSFFAMLMGIALYGLMGLTPMIPKRLFLPLPLFMLVAELLLVPCSIYFYNWLPQFGWGISFCQVILGLSLLYWSGSGFAFRWPLLAEERVGVRPFSWWNLSAFLLANVFVLLPVVMAYFVVCAALAVDHLTEGFMTVRPRGLTVRVRKYVRRDGKMIQLFPMSHIADANFYQNVSQSFPANSIVMAEGVTDERNLLTNKISYKRLATALGLGEQHHDFKPSRGKIVAADVDVDQFATNTIDLLNLAMLIHAQGVNAETVLRLLQYPEPPHFQEQLIDDLIRKRNQHLVEEIQARLAQADNIMVPWGAAHMPGIAEAIQKSGFRLKETQEYVAVRFHFMGNAGIQGKSE
jgi:hypothetical protein